MYECVNVTDIQGPVTETCTDERLHVCTQKQANKVLLRAGKQKQDLKRQHRVRTTVSCYLFAITGARHWAWETFFLLFFLNIFYRLNSLPPRSCHQEAEVMTQMPSVSLTPCLVLLFIAGFMAVFLRPQLRQSLRA